MNWPTPRVEFMQFDSVPEFPAARRIDGCYKGGGAMRSRVIEFGDGLTVLLFQDAGGWRVRTWRVITVRKGREVYRANPPPLKDVVLRMRFGTPEDAKRFLQGVLRKAGFTVDDRAR
jgi:hypothetical protein